MAREVTYDADGPDTLTDADIDPEHGDIALCRCGLTGDPPFCDGSHRAAREEAEGRRYRYVDGERRVVDAIRTEPPDEAEEHGGEGDEDGPDGSDRGGVEVGTGTRLVTREAAGPAIVDPEDLAAAGGSIAVCRCGLSGDFPFCDGSHAACADEGDACYRYVAGEGGPERLVVTDIALDEDGVGE